MSNVLNVQTCMPVAWQPPPPTKSKVNVTSHPDEFVNSEQKEEKEGLSKKAKLGIAGSIGVGALIAFYIAKGKFTEAKKLAEHIDFKPAKTIEEARNFAKTHLGIKNYDNSMPLDIANWVNEVLVNICNVNKGKTKMPKTISYQNMKDTEAIACMVSPTEGEKLGGILNINKSCIESIGDEINCVIKDMSETKIAFTNKHGKLDFYSFYKNADGSANLIESLNRFIENPDSFNLIDKIKLYEDLSCLVNAYNSFHKAPLAKIKQLLKNDDICNILRKNNKLLDIKEVEKFTTKKQEVILVDFVNTCIDSNYPIHLQYSQGDKFKTIYHEIAHLLHEQSAGYKFFKQMGKEDECVKEFGKITDITDEFLKNQDKQQIANRISAYAPESPLELVGDIYAEIISRILKGKPKLDGDIMKLYNDYKGPKVPGY